MRRPSCHRSVAFGLYEPGTAPPTSALLRRIASAIAELGYAPNRMAQGLSLRRSHTIGLVVANIANPFYAELIRGAEEVAAGEGF